MVAAYKLSKAYPLPLNLSSESLSLSLLSSAEGIDQLM